MADKGISLREFGRRVGVSGEYIRRAVEEGKIPADCVGRKAVGKGGTTWPVITDPVKAEREWRKSRDPDQVRDPEVMAAGAKRGWQQRRGEDPADDGGAGDDGHQDVDELPRAAAAGGARAAGNLPTIADSRRQLAAIKTQDAMLDLQKKRGTLVSAEAVRVRHIGMITAAKNRLLGIPTKAKSDIPTLTVRDIEVLEQLIAEALEELAVDER